MTSPSQSSRNIKMEFRIKDGHSGKLYRFVCHSCLWELTVRHPDRALDQPSLHAYKHRQIGHPLYTKPMFTALRNHRGKDTTGWLKRIKPKSWSSQNGFQSFGADGAASTPQWSRTAHAEKGLRLGLNGLWARLVCKKRKQKTNIIKTIALSIKRTNKNRHINKHINKKSRFVSVLMDYFIVE